MRRQRTRPSARPRSRARRITVLAALAWLAAVVVTGVIASRAVAVLDTQSAQTGVLSPAEVDRALVAARTASSPAATPSVTPTLASPDPAATPSTAPSGGAGTAHPSPHPSVTSHPSPSVTASATPGQVVRTWPVTGGTVAAACTATTIRLLYATPQDGWTVDVRSTGPDRVSVELKGTDRETQVTAVCVGGVPQPTVSNQAPDGPGGHDSGD